MELEREGENFRKKELSTNMTEGGRQTNAGSGLAGGGGSPMAQNE